MPSSIKYTQADKLRSSLRQLQTEHQETVSKATADLDAAGGAEQELRRQLAEAEAAAEECRARVAAAEREVRAHAAARAAAGERKEAVGGAEEAAAAATAAAVAAAEAAAEESSAELSRLKKAFREERAEHEAMLLASRWAQIFVVCACGCCVMFQCYMYSILALRCCVWDVCSLDILESSE